MNLRERLQTANFQQMTSTTDPLGLSWPRIVEHSLRTALTAVVSILVARWFGLRESYWAPITSLVITQSSLGAALIVSSQRFVGTVLGALVGAILATYYGPSPLVFGIGVFLLGLFSALVRAGRAAYRFSGVTLAIVLLVPRTGPAWRVSIHRFAEVIIGIAVALAMSVIWPERDVEVEDPQPS
jgi:uncharacterized membrane protein YgaE (UPF0421/DUF939 family)